jgi:RNA polymerase sigma-70 factor (ECF subfamily)
MIDDASERTERELVEQVLDGDREAFLDFIDRYERLVKHVVFRMVDDDRDREELCQDVFMRAYRYLDGFRFESKLSTWLARIARNTCLNHLEKKEVDLYADHAPAPDDDGPPDARAALNRIEDPDADVAEAATDRERRAVVREAIKTLSEHYRTALTLYHLEGMSVSQISDIMDNPEGTVKSHLYRGRKKLKDWLLDHYSQEELTL